MSTVGAPSTSTTRPPEFVKTYDDPGRATAAAAHHRWLNQLDSGVRLPRLLQARPDRLVFEFLPGPHPGPGDLDSVAEALGRLHAVAHATALHAVRLDTPFLTDQGVTIPDFLSPRRAALIDAPPLRWHDLPVALYKDANPRNFLLSGRADVADASAPNLTATRVDAAPVVAIIDFDDLTLAPVGYDLAKLVVTTAMTHGQLDDAVIGNALRSYNELLRSAVPTLAPCQLAELRYYAELHHRLTAPYLLNRGGYIHPWPTVRPWPRPIGWPPP